MAGHLSRSVEELYRTVSEDEIAEWAAYWQVEPFGSPAEDSRFANVCSILWRANSAPGSEIPDFFDRVPEETARRNAMVAVDEDEIMSFFAAMKARPTEADDEEAEAPTADEDTSR